MQKGQALPPFPGESRVLEQYDTPWAKSHGNPIDVGLESDDALLVFFSGLRVATFGWTPSTKPSWGTFYAARLNYQAFRLELGRDAMLDAWNRAKAGAAELAPLMAYSAAYRLMYRGSPAQKRHQAKYQSKTEVKARRAELARNRRAARKAARS
jgi:hypothetical protein